METMERKKQKKSGRHSEDGENERGLEGRLCRGGRARRGAREGSWEEQAAGRKEALGEQWRKAGGEARGERSRWAGRQRAGTVGTEGSHLDPGAHGPHGGRRGVHAQAGSRGAVCLSRREHMRSCESRRGRGWGWRVTRGSSRMEGAGQGHRGQAGRRGRSAHSEDAGTRPGEHWLCLSWVPEGLAGA